MKRSRLQRKTPLRRTAMNRKPARRVARRARFLPFILWVKSLACISCGHEGPSDAAHMPVGPRGMGLKAPDTSVVPLCRSCHLWFDGHGDAKQAPTATDRRWYAGVWLGITHEAAPPALLPLLQGAAP